MLSNVAKSNLFTKGVAAQHDKRQRVRKNYGVPDVEVRKLLAKLILEEALETVNAMGFTLSVSPGGTTGYLAHIDQCTFLHRGTQTDLLEVIDGCCDTVYVCVGALVACGVPDEPHLWEVCNANNTKFPGGTAKIDPETGKYLKPLGWEPPDHAAVRKRLRPLVDFTETTAQILAKRKNE